MGIVSGITNTLKSALGFGQLKTQTTDLTKMVYRDYFGMFLKVNIFSSKP